MTKKGEITSRTVILWGIAAFVLVVVAFANFGPQLWGGVTKAAFAFGIGALPDQEAPQLEGEVPIPPQLELEFNKLVENINNANSPAINSCLVDITELSGFEDNWRIELADNKATLYRVTDTGARVDKKTATLNTFKPCILKGSLAENFYNCFLKDNNPVCSSISPSLETITLSQDNRYKFLYKPNNEFACSFLFYSGSCEVKGDPKGLGNDCKSKIPSFDRNLVKCDDIAGAGALAIKIDTEHDKTEVWDFKLTNDKIKTIGENTFNLDDFNHKIDGKNACAVFAVEEGGGDDNAQVWHAKPGSLIEKRDIGGLGDGFKSPYNNDCIVCSSGPFCVNKCGNKFKASPNPKDSQFLTPDDGRKRSTIGGEWYTTLVNDHCDDASCILLEKDASNNEYWKPKNEILCNDDGRWSLCNGAIGGKTAVAEGITYTCQSNKWIGGPQKKPVGSRILFVKIDPGDSPVEKWAFYLTDDENLPIDDVDLNQRKFEDIVAGKKVCNVYSVNEEGGGGGDHLSTWYIGAGGRIMTQPDANDLFTGINGKIAGVKQDTSKRKGSPYGPGPDGHPEAVGMAQYSASTGKDNCGDKFHPCNLLERSGTNHKFIPKYELLCDDEGYWKVCEDYVNLAVISAGGVSYFCKEESGRWVWEESSVGDPEG